MHLSQHIFKNMKPVKLGTHRKAQHLKKLIGQSQKKILIK